VVDGPWRLVTVDIDGTLTRVHGWAAIADAVGRTAEFDRSQRRFFAHRIGEDEHLRDLLGLVAGRPLSEVEAALESTPHLAGIAEGVDDLRGRGVRVALLSHNPAYVGEWYRRRFGFDDFEGTVGQEVRDGRVGPAGPVRADKVRGLLALTGRAGAPVRRVVHVGDGWADVRIFARVGRGVALNSAHPDVERAADLALRTDDFRDVARAIARLGPRP
jgi:phosphoserine phosphatase